MNTLHKIACWNWYFCIFNWFQTTSKRFKKQKRQQEIREKHSCTEKAYAIQDKIFLLEKMMLIRILRIPDPIWTVYGRMQGGRGGVAPCPENSGHCPPAPKIWKKELVKCKNRGKWKKETKMWHIMNIFVISDTV